MLQAKNITFETVEKKLIDRVNIDFKPSVLHGIVGPNGAGKSTFLKTLAGIWPPSFGNVFWKGENIHLKSRKEVSRTLSFVPQHTQVAFDFEVFDIVLMGRYAHETKSEHLVEWALKTVDVWHLKNRRINEISHGERQRVYIARALCTQSKVLLLDEPTSSLDISHQLEIWKLLRGLLSKDKVIIVTTHDLSSAKDYCDTISVINQGKLIANGSYQEIMTQELLKQVFGVCQTSQGFKLPTRNLT
jgi:iron complex transport system ATP-binding protein